MGFLDSLRTYAGAWEETGREKLTAAEVKSIDHIEVVEKEQEWGTSVSMCFFMKAGGKKYKNLSTLSELEVGDEVDPKSVTIITLERDGEEPITRVDGKAL
jgi:hypothetical protein